MKDFNMVDLRKVWAKVNDGVSSQEVEFDSGDECCMGGYSK